MREWWKVLESKTNSAVSLQKQIRLAVNWLLSLKDYMSVIMIFPYGNIKLHGGSKIIDFLSIIIINPVKGEQWTEEDIHEETYEALNWKYSK